MKRRKTTACRKETTAIAKIPQPHGGALNNGGTPGNAGGGRPTNVAKQRLAEAQQLLAENAPSAVRTLKLIHEDEETEKAVRVRAANAVLEHAPEDLRLAQHEAGVRKRLEATLATIRQSLPAVEAERLVKAIEAHWVEKSG